MQGGVERRVWIAVALAHLALVAALFLLFRYGPRNGWATLLLYAPRAVFAVPALITVFALRGLWRLVPAVTTAVVLGPLMGLHLSGPGRPGKVRLITWNLWFGAGDRDAIRDTLARAKPDLVLLQAVGHGVDEVLRGPPFEGFAVLRETQYVLASRWPARPVKGLADPGGWQSWAQFEVESPFGKLAVFAVHPHSPRALLRGSVRRAIASDAPEMQSLEGHLRELDEAAREAGALRVLGGDFNLPDGAGIWSRIFEGSEDAFAKVGNGYGYTYPLANRRVSWRWLRLDRVLTGPGLRATRAEVIGGRGSTHAAVVVEVEARGAR